MIGIYKIISPSGKIYIGQSVDIEKRKKLYVKHKCENQIKLYRSLVKYGFSAHIFEIQEECTVEKLNIQERHWQDYYNVLSENGLNCLLTETATEPRIFSEDTKKNMSLSHKILNNTEKGREARKKAVTNTDYKARNTNTDYKARTASINYLSFQQKRVANTDYTSFQEKRVVNTDFKTRAANTDYKAIAKKLWVPILQISKDGSIIQEWNSATEASKVVGVSRGDISNCIQGRQKTAKGFIWKYKNNQK